ncbi:uncharacterized protein LOC131240979 [Magnolia sinica]|uniref:uncharacterized protein LOC131240979 n=1 Tax=Magnolia sinica TaxID=86752 RepID=UPI00265B60A4|nr:uncharacterized protein LOC131240979 [Magnolia sinica]
MASKKKEAEGIALLSMYNDEDMDPDEDDQDDDDDDDEEEDEYIQDKDADRNEPYDPRNEDRFTSDSAPETTPPLPQSQTPIPTNEDPTVKSPAPPTPQPHLPLSSPPLPPPPLPASDTSDAPTSRTQPRGIVDYAHDETAMSPEAEEGEIVSTGHLMLGSELQVTGGNFLEKTPPGTVHILTPSIQATPPQPSEPQAEQQQEQSKSENSATMNNSRTEPEAAQMEVDVEVSVEIEKENVDPLEKFLPPPPKTKCPEELQKKINKFLDYKRAGKSFNADLRNRKDYRNPDFLLHAVRYQDIDQIGTCFSKDVFDPHGYDKSDYYDEIEADMKREMERKEQEKKRAQKVEFVQGGTQPGIVGPAPKISTQIPVAGVSSVASGLHSISTATDAMPRESRQNKKTKWDKVDGDKRNPLHSGGQDATISTAGAHAALLSAANAGAGYTAFAQQKRREAEEKRSSERKLERQS